MWKTAIDDLLEDGGQWIKDARKNEFCVLSEKQAMILNERERDLITGSGCAIVAGIFRRLAAGGSSAIKMKGDCLGLVGGGSAVNAGNGSSVVSDSASAVIVGDGGKASVAYDGVAKAGDNGHADGEAGSVTYSGRYGRSTTRENGVAYAGEYGMAVADKRGAAIVRAHGLAFAYEDGIAIAWGEGARAAGKLGAQLIFIGQRTVTVTVDGEIVKENVEYMMSPDGRIVGMGDGK